MGSPSICPRQPLSVLAGGAGLWVRVGKPNGGPSCFASRASPGLSVSGRAHPAAFSLLAVSGGPFQVGCSGWFGIGPLHGEGLQTGVSRAKPLCGLTCPCEGNRKPLKNKDLADRSAT